MIADLARHLILRQRVAASTALAGFVLTAPISNWLIQNVGTICLPAGPCLIPVFPGMMAPSGVLMVGLALVLRDIVHARLGGWWAFGAIIIGCAISATFAPRELILASGAAFLLSELVDFAIFVPLRRRGFFVAAFISSLVGLLLDSIVFLRIAFGGLEYLPGQILGKTWMVAVSLALLWICSHTGFKTIFRGKLPEV